MAEEFLHNSGFTITKFYVEKLLFILWAAIAAVFCYHDYIDNDPFWMVCLLIGVVALFISDAHVMAIGRDGTRLTLHHLWRQSSLELTTARILWRSGGGNWLIRKPGVEALVAMGKWPWQLYFVYCDQKNNLSAMLDKYQTH
ncbi:hypothetical protein [Pseudodesulfovibrio indicus]|uniref:Toxin CptA n=1 Tax=Pseudodesulfovibrio indicus TaxID=1716143 RepID=A0A126QKL2_9BACT|nr:hypothetical protein [Pseudodesulfovibrio indicus]AMK10336.1 hypothetical protein AWY79_03990 [Pseudodesulfovibrio indicus]TDT81978.1 hypothetical protein EDC59_11929 [Pseudodesulfovibrio indicus]